MVKRRFKKKMQNQETNGNAPPLSTSLARDTSQQVTQKGRNSPYGYNKVHRPVIDIESSEKPVEEVPAEQSKASSVSLENGFESKPPGPAEQKTAVQKPRSENERTPKKHCMTTRSGNRRLDKIPVSTRVVPKQDSKKPEVRKSDTRGGGQFRQTHNPPRPTHPGNQSSTRNRKDFSAKTSQLELKEEEPFNRKNTRDLEENVLFISGSKTPEPNEEPSSENVEIENKISPDLSSVETSEDNHVGEELLVITTVTEDSTVGADNVEGLEEGEIPDIPSEINDQSTEDNGMANVSVTATEIPETSKVQETVLNTTGAFPVHFNMWQHVNRGRSIETDIFKKQPARQAVFKNFSKSNRGKPNTPKPFWPSPKQHDEVHHEKNENKDCLARLIKSEETVRRKFESKAKGREYVLMFIPEAFDDGSLDESTLTRLYGRFNVDQVICHYNKNGERLGSGTLRVWDQIAEKVENHVPDRKWRALRMLPLKNHEVSENADQVAKAFVQFLDEWSEEKIKKALHDACPQSDVQMVYDYDNKSLKSAFVTMKYSDIEKLNIVASTSNNMVHPLQVRIFEVPGI